jgi:CubicO group peptidase (beta-lactamase class C family)
MIMYFIGLSSRRGTSRCIIRDVEAVAAVRTRCAGHPRHDRVPDGQDIVGRMSTTGLAKLHDLVAGRVTGGALPGLVYLVSRGGEVHAEAIGTFEFGGGAPMRRDTVFRIASITKPILTAGAMVLVEEGTLALDAPVDRWLPELADRRVLRHIDGPLDDTVPAQRPITVEDVLTFRMGYGMVVEPSFDPPYPVIEQAAALELMTGPPEPRTPHDPDEWIRRFGTLPLMEQPGELWRYNVSSLVLSVLVARAAGQSLADVLRTRIFTPLGMASTGFALPPGYSGELPATYMTNFGTGEMERQTSSPTALWQRPPVFPSGAGGLLSTVDDLLAFARMMAGGGTYQGRQVLTAESVRAMTTNYLSDDQIARGGAVLGGRGWGYGMSVVVRPDDISSVPGRYGWEGGSGTSWFNHPELDLTAILLTQVSDVLFNGTLQVFGRAAVEAF